MPSSIVIGLFFIGWTQTPLLAAQATVIVPTAQGISALLVIEKDWVISHSQPYEYQLFAEYISEVDASAAQGG